MIQNKWIIPLAMFKFYSDHNFQSSTWSTIRNSPE